MTGTRVRTQRQEPTSPASEAGRPGSAMPVQLKLSALWASTMLLFAYGDLFGLYRRDIIADLDRGELAGFPVGQPFLLAASVYVAIPCLMVAACLVMRPRVARWTNIVLALVYVLTIAGAMIGDGWVYYLFLGVLEIGLLAAVVRYAWRWSVPADDVPASRA